MKLLKRVLSILCAILLVTDICLASCLNVYAREYYRADDVIVEESQSEAMLQKAKEMTPASEAAPAQQLETPAADTVQTETTTEVEITEAAKETALSETQDSAEPETDGKQNSSESQDENIKETKETEETESKEPEEEFVPTMEYEDNDVKVHVAAVTPNAIPKNATLKVVPIVERTPVKGMTAEEVAEINDINNQYKEVEKKLAEKSENEEYDIAGFLAYDITFVDKDGNKVEPKGEVKVSMDYKKAIIPAEAAKADVEATDVTVMHFEEDANGQVKEIVDMVADETKEATVQTTENAEVKKTEFVTDSFSMFTITWTEYWGNVNITVHYVNAEGKDIPNVTVSPDLSDETGEIDLKNDSRYNINIPKYTFKRISVGSFNGTTIQKIRRSPRQKYQVQYLTDGGTVWTDWIYFAYSDPAEGHIYFVYEGPETAGETGGTGTNEGDQGEKASIKEVSKSASVVNEAERTFKINLSAITEESTYKPASFVLVLDSSLSMTENGKTIGDIQQAAKDFVQIVSNNTPQESDPNTRQNEISVVWYGANNPKNAVYEDHEGKWKSGDRTTINDTTACSGFQPVSTKKGDIDTYIGTRAAGGGTPMGDALQRAYEQVQAAHNPDNVYVLLFTDGMPGYNKDLEQWNCQVANNANNYAKKIKSKATLYTVGYHISTGDTFKWTEGHKDSGYTRDHTGSGDHVDCSASNFLQNKIATAPEYHYTVNGDATELSGIFTSIANNIEEQHKVQPTKIEDVIDARFELPQTSREKLIEKFHDGSKPDENGIYNGVVFEDNADGTTTIRWIGTAAMIDQEGWQADFEIKAKHDFIGGNMVPTNGSASGIYLTSETIPFPQPSVNVQPLSLSMKNMEKWAYNGDDIAPMSTADKPTSIADELYDTFKIVELDGTTITETGKQKWPELTDTQKAKLKEEGNLTIDKNEEGKPFAEYFYRHPGTQVDTSDPVGYFVYKYKVVEDAGKELGEMKGHDADKEVNAVEKYELTVEFVPYTVGERDEDQRLSKDVKRPSVETTEAGEPPKGGTELDPTKDKLTADGEYTVNVVAGKIQITKEIEDDAVSDGPQVFTFNITMKEDSEFNETVKIEIKGKEKSASCELDNLDRGTYVVTEVFPEGEKQEYVVKDINVEKGETKTNCGSTTVAKESVTLEMGKNTEHQEVIVPNTDEVLPTQETIYLNEYIGNGVLGSVKCTNIKQSTPGTTPPSTSTSISKQKYIKKNNDGSYDLTLNVTAPSVTITKNTPMDIVLVLDNSQSFDSTELYNMKEAAKSMIGGVDPQADVQWKIISFNNEAVKRFENEDWAVDPEDAKADVDEIKRTEDLDYVHWGTNYEAGLKEAANALGTCRKGSQKVVVFLTDGKPEFYEIAYTMFGVPYPTGRTDQITPFYDGLRAAEGIRCDQFYAVGVNLNPSSTEDYGGDYGELTPHGVLEEIKKKVTATTYKTTKFAEDEDLSTILPAVGESIVKNSYKNVEITDTLTDYVQLNADASMTITMKDSAGKEVASATTKKLSEWTPINPPNGKEVSDNITLTKADETTISMTVKYEPVTGEGRNGKITLKFPENYELEKGMTYDITMNISPTQKAVDEYVSKGYPDKGDAGTDVPGIDEADYISSGKLGFHSNTTATLTYKYGDMDPTVDPYDHPVVQVSKTIDIVKKWVDGDNAHHTRDGVELKFKVQQCVPKEGVDEKNWGWKDYKAPNDTSTKTYTEYTMTAAKADKNDPSIWKLTVSDLPLKNEQGERFVYKIVEVNVPNGYTASYAGDSNANVTNTLDWKIIKQSKEVDDNGAHRLLGDTVFSLKKTAELDGTAVTGGTVEPNVPDGEYYGVSQSGTGELKWFDSYTEASGESSPLNYPIPDGIYELKEIKAHVGYALSSKTWTLHMKDGVLKKVEEDGKELKLTASGKEGVKLYIENEQLYELPSTGGLGIYWYFIGGTLFMMAAALILYKNKHGEVLKR